MMKKAGFTLIEILLVLVIASALLLMLIGYTTQKADELRRDYAALQMQQILNAALAYYVTKGSWPMAIAGTQWQPLDGTQLLQTSGYLPTKTFVGPLGIPILVKNTNKTSISGGNFAIQTQMGQDATGYNQATILAGRLPLAFVADADSLKQDP